MEAPVAVEEEVSERYSIPIEEFKTQPQFDEIDPRKRRYIMGERVTRENFLSMFLQSFRLSLGAVPSQWAYLEWLDVNTGFDWQTTLRNFFKAGGLSCLTEEERSQFTESFRGINRHYRSRPELKPTVPGVDEKERRAFIRNRISLGMNEVKRDLFSQKETTNNRRIFPDLRGLSKRELVMHMKSEAKYQRVLRVTQGVGI